MADTDTVADVDEALAHLSFDQRRITDPERWTRWVDDFLDRRLELEPCTSR